MLFKFDYRAIAEFECYPKMNAKVNSIKKSNNSVNARRLPFTLFINS